MKILDNSDKYLLPKLAGIVAGHLQKNVEKLKFIGGGSFGRVYKATIADGQPIALKAYRVQGSQHKEAMQLRLLRAHTPVQMPQVLFVHESEDIALLAMTFAEGQNVLNPAFLFKSKPQK